jgi:FKBP-type peptidyl-prolyl cis-trans isomerase
MKLIKLTGLSALVLLAACSQSPFPGFDKTESGLYYSIDETNDEGRRVMMDDIVTIDLKYSTDDSVLYDSEKVPFPTQLRVGQSAYNGDVMEGFTLLREGEHGVFKTSADSFFTKIANIDRPEFVDSGSYLTFDIRIIRAQTYDELAAEKQVEAEENKEIENGLIAAFLEENNITDQPKESGLYFIETAAGDGVPVERGKTVKVHYLGRLLSGEKFDASYDRGEPIEFTLGTGQVIPGWDEGIGYMTKGSKAMLIIPSSMAYGDQPPPGSIIKAYSPLVFDVELLDVN